MKSHIHISEDEARQLLGISRGVSSSTAIQKAYMAQMKKWTTARNGALSFEHRERASDAIGLLHEARKCLNHSSSSSMSSTRAGYRRPGQRSAQPASKRQMWPFIRAIVSFFRGVRATVRSIIRFIKVFCEAGVRTKEVLTETLELLKTLGIPKFVSVLIMLWLVLAGLHGCSQAITRVNGVQHNLISSR